MNYFKWVFSSIGWGFEDCYVNYSTWLKGDTVLLFAYLDCIGRVTWKEWIGEGDCDEADFRKSHCCEEF